MQIHELNTKALTDPAWVPFDGGSDTYKADFNQIIDDAVAEAYSSADVSGGVVEYESEDAEPLSDAEWSTFDLLEGGENLETLFTLVSAMAYNLRYVHSRMTAESFTGTRGSDLNAGECYGIYDRAACTVRLYVSFTASSSINVDTTLFTIPAEYRPSTTYGGVLFFQTTSSTGAVGGMRVTSGGIVQQRGSSSATKGIGIIEYPL